MSRRERIGYLLDFHYPEYRQSIEPVLVSALRKLRGSGDTSDAVIDEIRLGFDLMPSEMWADEQKLKETVAELQAKFSNSSDDEQARELWRRYIDDVRTYEADLSDMASDKLLELYDSTRLSERVVLEADAADHDFDRFFSERDANADFRYWGSLAGWTVDEAVALILGKDPRVVSWQRLRPYATMGRSPFGSKFIQLRKALNRAVQAGTVPEVSSPSQIIEWCKNSCVDLKEVDLTALAEYEYTDWKKRYEKESRRVAELETELKEKHSQLNRSSETKRRKSLHRVILAMAINRYGHVTSGNSGVAKTIVSEAAEVELYFGEDIVRDMLSEAAAELEYEWKERRWVHSRRLAKPNTD